MVASSSPEKDLITDHFTEEQLPSGSVRQHHASSVFTGDQIPLSFQSKGEIEFLSQEYPLSAGGLWFGVLHLHTFS